MILKINPLPGVVFSGLPPPSGSASEMVENSPPIPLTGNKVGGLFTILPVSSVIGSTTNDGVVDRVMFDPSAVDLGLNTISYTYTDVNGCTNSVSQDVFVNPVTTVDFSVQGAFVNENGEFECQNTLLSGSCLGQVKCRLQT